MPTGPDEEPEEAPPPVDVGGRLSGMNELPSAGGFGGGDGATEGEGVEVSGGEELDAG
jgi:hypothetical protein